MTLEIDLLQYEKGKRHWLHPLEKYKHLIDQEREKFLKEQTTKDKYDPNEARESSGKWTAGGGSSRKQPTQKQTTSFVSPNEDPTTLSFEQAVSGLKTKRQKLLAGISHSIDSDLGINDIRINSVVGAWSDGAENSVMTNSAAADPDIEEAAAAMKGYLANQKAVLLFHPDDKGNQFLAQFRIPNNDLAAIHKKLLDNGVIFHTLEPRGNDTLVHFYGETRDDAHLIADAAKQFGQKVQATRGHGKFIPPEVKEDGTDAEQRAASRQAYLDTIRRVGLTGKLPSGFESKWQNHIDNWQRETGEQIGGGESKPAKGSDRVTTDKYDPDEPRDPGGKWTSGGGSGGKKSAPETKETKTKRAPWIEEVAEQSGVPSPTRPKWIQELAEKEENRPTVISKAAHAAVHGAVHLLGEFSEEDYEMLREHLAPRSKTREGHAHHILRIASTLPALLGAHFREEYHKFKHAAGALKALVTGHRPTHEQWKGLRQAATTILLAGAMFMMTGEPTGAAAHAVEHVAEQVAEHGAVSAAEHSAVAAAHHLAAEFGHELVTHTIYEHMAKLGLGVLRFGGSAALGSFVHIGEHEEKEKKETKDAETDSGEFTDEEIKLLQDYLKTLSDVVATYPITDEQLHASLPNKKETKSEDAYDPSEARDPGGKWTSGGGSSAKHKEEKEEPDDYEEPAYSDPSEKIPPEYHEEPLTPAKSNSDFTPPKKTVKAYKLFETRPDQPGKLFPLFQDADTGIPVGEWAIGKPVPSKTLAPRPGWHAGVLPLAPHLRDSGTHTKIKPTRVWAEVELPDDVDWQKEADKNGRMSKGTKKNPSHWISGDLPNQVPHGGHYKFNTKPGQGGQWLIGGAVRVTKVLSDQEVHDILVENGKPNDAKYETNRSEPFPFKPGKTKDSRFRFLHVHTIDRVFKLVLRNRDAAFDPTDHPTAPKGTKGKYKGGEFVPKGGKPSGGSGTGATSKTTKPTAAAKAANTRTTTTTAKQANTKTTTKSTTVPTSAEPASDPIANATVQTGPKPKKMTIKEIEAANLLHPPKTDTAHPLKGSKGHPGLVSVVTPSTQRDYGTYHQPNQQYMKEADPEQYKTNIGVFDNSVLYPLPQETFHGSDDDVYHNIVNHIKSNLKFIYDNTPKEERDRTKQWYNGARKMVDRKVEQYKKYKLKDTTVAGLYACLSPINLWDQNVRQADQMIDIYCKQQDTAWNKEMDAVTENWKSGEMKVLSDLARGKKLKDIKDVKKGDKVISAARIKAHWIRLYDMAHNTGGMEWQGKKLDYQPFHAITPEGEYKEWYLTDAGKPQKFGWHTPDMMEKAVKILDSDGNRDIISANLGKKHKVRSFYNNILDPDSDNNDVTMDTHAIDAAWMMDAPAAVFHNFGLGPQGDEAPYGWERGTAGSTASGIEGTYGFYSDAYREVAKDIGIKPRELQSIVWETKRKWMGNMTPTELDKVAHLWKNYQEGRILGGIEDTQRRVKQIIDQSAKDREAKKNAPAPEKPYRYRTTPSWTPSSNTDPYEYAYMPPKAKKGDPKPIQEKPQQQLPQSTDPDPYDEYEIYRAEMNASRSNRRSRATEEVE